MLHWLCSLLYIIVAFYLSQLAVYNQIRGTLNVSTAIQKYITDMTITRYPNECCQCCCDCVKNTCCGQLQINEFIIERNGPALTLIVRPKYGEEMTHVDFTFGIFCPQFPDDFQRNFSILLFLIAYFFCSHPFYCSFRKF